MSIFNFSTGTLYFLFAAIIILFLVIDLGILNRSSKKVSFRSALVQSAFWVLISLAFAYLIYLGEKGGYLESESDTVQDGLWLTYLSAYLVEKSMSLDNIFVMLLILRYFNVEDKHYHKILFWGILGAVVFRAFFIYLGAWLVGEFYWILYIFGAFLVYSGIKLIFDSADEDPDLENNQVFKLASKTLPLTKHNYGGKFAIIKDNKLYFTPLFLVIILIETTDIIFAVDSIPAAFAITQNEFIIYTSNIFAVLGLRAMFFLLASIIDRFYLLQKGVSAILVFVGAKMLLEIFDIHVANIYSFLVIVGSITISMILSLILSDRSKNDPIPAKK
ncbi:MAG: TerC/Alx family metal homeostasis membrane protein [Cyclobacteriaceae bacterium]|nr:TerC/Alx family metal homeostasis membrane protein [Cyclobacteriaceae bacterium]MCH8515202.1 TerC/Alx family metal homeostasis membrane protein [Cyclobacteriaceae bacterium]